MNRRQRFSNENNFYLHEDLKDFSEHLSKAVYYQQLDVVFHLSKLIQGVVDILEKHGYNTTIEQARQIISGQATPTTEEEKRLYRYKNIIETAESLQTTPQWN